MKILPQKKKAAKGGHFSKQLILNSLQSTLNFKTPGFKEGFWYVLAVFISARPLAEASRPDVLIRRQLEFLDCLLKGGDNGDDWPDGLRLAPVWITASPCHIRFRPAFR